jgi:hypothetical protein
MSLRIRKDGTILCGAMSIAEEGDVYIDDNIHYYLSVLTEAIVPCKKHFESGLWYWNIKKGLKEHYKCESRVKRLEE